MNTFGNVFYRNLREKDMDVSILKWFTLSLTTVICLNN